jgi:hypothetical protein
MLDNLEGAANGHGNVVNRLIVFRGHDRPLVVATPASWSSPSAASVMAIVWLFPTLAGATM